MVLLNLKYLSCTLLASPLNMQAEGLFHFMAKKSGTYTFIARRQDQRAHLLHFSGLGNL